RPGRWALSESAEHRRGPQWLRGERAHLQHPSGGRHTENTHTHTHTRALTHHRIHTSTHTQQHPHSATHTHTHTHAHAHAHTHTHTHISLVSVCVPMLPEITMLHTQRQRGNK